MTEHIYSFFLDTKILACVRLSKSEKTRDVVGLEERTWARLIASYAGAAAGAIGCRLQGASDAKYKNTKNQVPIG